jgi:undecaprenyl-diphosphatase
MHNQRCFMSFISDVINPAVMGIVEGLTEFLPVSSTGHLILTGNLLGMDLANERVQVFTIAVQTGAILALCVYYWQKIWAILKGLPKDTSAQKFAINVAIACLPAVVLGLLFNKKIKAVLFNAPVVATTFIIGGFIILWAERRNTQPRVNSTDELTLRDAFKVGLVQCLSLVPGTSRSGSTIIGGMLLGLKRQVATEFSFFMAIPLLIGAAGYDVYKHRAVLSMADLPLFGVGIVASFITALLVIRWLLRYVASHTFVVFAYYRIAFGMIVLLTAHFDWVIWAN